MNTNKTLYQKLFDSHVIHESKNEIPIIYIDRHLIHEVTSPQAFNNLHKNNRQIHQPNKTFATIDHNISTKHRNINKLNKESQIQVKELLRNCKKFGIHLYDLKHPSHGIIHVISPEEGIILPGMTVICGDSHTSTHGAFGTLSFGVGTSDIEHVLVTQTIRQKRFKNMKIEIFGKIPSVITAKDIALFIISKIGNDGGIGYVIEFCGSIVKNMSMESRMTLCNMSVEMGAKSGIIAPDNITFNFLKNRHFSPCIKEWKEAKKYWSTLKSDINAKFDKIIKFNISNISPQITWGTNPSQVIGIDETIPNPEKIDDPILKATIEKSLKYMNLKPNTKLTNVKIDKVFIGSCTNSRIEDLRSAANIIKGKKIALDVIALVVPGSNIIKNQAEKEGLDKIFLEAGFEWRLPGCSMCLGMNDDVLKPGERCASTSNRNFEGRQGRDSRTHLMSPMMAAAAAIFGHFVDIRQII